MSPRERVVIAMSGGVDSSVAAALLVQQGYEVIGMMMRLWSESGMEAGNRCCAPDSMTLARRVASILKIPFYVIDARKIFRETVVDYFLHGYAHHQTPNPCLVCNRQIRWGFMLNQALQTGASHMATGHYARITQDNSGQYQLRKAIDSTKDQSYILHVLSQEKLSQTIFPLGEMTKVQAREWARQHGLPIADRPDSQDLCFLGEGDYRQFLVRNAPETAKPGKIVNRSGEIIGEHQGLAFYTIGQRKGLGLSSPLPMYVLEKDASNNLLIVGYKHELGKSSLDVDEINWISGRAPGEPFRAQVKIRYKSREAYAMITPTEPMQAHVIFDEPQRDITPGQAVVFYDSDICLGGGTIH